VGESAGAELPLKFLPASSMSYLAALYLLQHGLRWKMEEDKMADEEVRTFLAIAKHRDVDAAGRALGLSRSTMEARLADLFANRGRRLLERTPSGYALTSAGEAMLAHFEWIKTEVLAMERSGST
jgi:hypothetical protein